MAQWPAGCAWKCEVFWSPWLSCLDRLTPWPLGRGDYICPILEEMKLDAQNVAGHFEWFPPSKIIFFFFGGEG